MKSLFENVVNMAIWLFQLSTQTNNGGLINIRAADEYAFISSCKNGHLNIAKWLFQLGSINIHSLGDYALMLSCENDHLEIVKWLIQISKQPEIGLINIHRNKDYIFDYLENNQMIDSVNFYY